MAVHVEPTCLQEVTAQQLDAVLVLAVNVPLAYDGERPAFVIGEPSAPGLVVTAVLLGRVELRAVVLGRVAELRCRQVEPPALTTRTEHLPLRLRTWQPGRQPPHPQRRLGRRLGARVGQRCQVPELDDAAEALVARQLVHQLRVAEPPQPQHLVEPRDGLVGVTQTPEVAGRPQRGGHAQSSDHLDVARGEVSLTTRADTVAESEAGRALEDRHRRDVTGPAGRQDHLRTVQPAGRLVGHDRVGRYDERQCLQAEGQRVAGTTRRRTPKAISLRTAPRSTSVRRRDRDTPAAQRLAERERGRRGERPVGRQRREHIGHVTNRRPDVAAVAGARGRRWTTRPSATAGDAKCRHLRRLAPIPAAICDGSHPSQPPSATGQRSDTQLERSNDGR